MQIQMLTELLYKAESSELDKALFFTNFKSALHKNAFNMKNQCMVKMTVCCQATFLNFVGHYKNHN